MGTFERIRQVSPYALGLFAVLFVGFMILSDADISSLIRQGNNPQTTALANVNGEEIKYVDYETAVKEEMEAAKKQQKDPNAEVNDQQIRRQLWSQLIDNAIIQQEAKALGINLNNEVVADILLNFPPDFLRKNFMDSTGTFARSIYLELVKNPDNYKKYMKGASPEDQKAAVDGFRKDLIRIEEFLKKSRAQENLMNAVNFSGGVVSPLYAREKYIADNSATDVNYLVVDSRGLNPKDFKVSDAEIQKYYEANKQYWPQKEQRKIKYLAFPIQANANDTARAVKRISLLNSILNTATNGVQKDSIFTVKMAEFSGTSSNFQSIKDIDPAKAPFLSAIAEREIVGPINTADGVVYLRLDAKQSGTNITAKASHILIKFNDNKDSAKAEANKIMKRVKAGEDFAKLVSEFSQDKGSVPNGGDVGYFGEGQMIKPFQDAVFGAKVGDLLGPVESEFGFHLIKVTDKITDQIKYSEIKIKPVISSVTKNGIIREAQSVVEQLAKGVQFDTLAARLKKRTQESSFFEKNRPVLGSQYIADKAFASEVGTVLEPKELPGFGYVVVQVSDSRTKGLVPLADKKEDIESKIRKEKMLLSVKAKADALYNKVKSYGSLEAARAADSTLNIMYGQQVKANGAVQGINGRDFVFTSKVTTLPLNQISAPFKGEMAYYIAEVKNRTMPDEAKIKQELPAFTKNLTQSSRSQNYYIWIANQKQELPIIDNRYVHYSEY